MPIRSGSGVIEKVAMPGRVGPTTRLQTGLGGTPGGPGNHACFNYRLSRLGAPHRPSQARRREEYRDVFATN
jgi:hypothetical protein